MNDYEPDPFDDVDPATGELRPRRQSRPAAPNRPMPRPQGRVLTQGEVEERILTLSDALAEGTEHFASVRALAAQAEADYKIAYHRAILTGNGGSNAEARKAYATTVNETAYRQHLDAEALVDAAKDAQNTLRARLDAERTLAANIRSQT